MNCLSTSNDAVSVSYVLLQHLLLTLDDYMGVLTPLAFCIHQVKKFYHPSRHWQLNVFMANL